MRFGTPLALLLLLIIPYLIWLGRPRRAAANREWLSLALRLAIVLLLTLGLAGTRLVRAADGLALVFLVDASDSVGAEQAEQAEDFVRGVVESMGPDERAAVVVFGANALVERPMSGLADLAPVTTIPLSLHTDLAEAIRLGLALFPTGSARRAVLISDGAATLGDTLGAAELASASGVAIDVVPLDRPVHDAEAYLRDVRAPTRVREGESFTIHVGLESTVATDAELQVLAGGVLVYQEPVSLQAGANNLVIRLQATEQQFARYVVQLIARDDFFYQNNRLAVFTQIDGPPQVLLVAGQQDAGANVDQPSSPAIDSWQQLQLALTATGLVVERISPADLPANLESLSNYDSVVLVDVNAKSLSQREMETLHSYVRDLGGGLVTVGGPESYGMGGYYRTPLEEMLPVEMQITDQERFPAVSMALVIDRSGSMATVEGGVSKIQLAAEGAVRTVELLNDFDQIAVLPVDTAADGTIGPASVSDRAQIIGQIRQLGAGGGGIYVRTGLEAAAAALAQSPNQIKHIILLADGADSEQKEGVPELINALAAEGVTISTVSIGDGPDTPWLRQMAELGGGRFHLTDQAASLPQIFTQETTAVQRSYLIEERFFPAVAGTGFARQHSLFRAMESSGITRVPPLYGYVGTSPKQTAQLILETHLGDPLLAAWEYGLGRSAAWTSDATGRWGIDWVDWSGFPTFWSNLVRWSISQEQGGILETEVQFTEEEALLTVDARDGGGDLLNDLALRAVVVDPAGETLDLALSQVAPGRYEASFLPAAEGAYLIRVASHSDEDLGEIGQTSGWVLGYSPEYRNLAGDPRLLNSIAELTGGRDLTSQFDEGDFAAVLSHDLPAGEASRPIWPWLLTLAVLLLPFDIAVRRIVITRVDGQRLWQRTLGRIWWSTVPEAERSERVTRLFRAKERAARRPEEEPLSESQPLANGEIRARPAEDPTDRADVDPAGAIDEVATDSRSPAGDKYESLAARLLERRRSTNQEPSDDDH
jgi:uncharacterized membrane protein